MTAERLPDGASLTVDMETGRILRSWLAGEEEVIPPCEPQHKWTGSHQRRLQHWVEYIQLSNMSRSHQDIRDAGLRSLMKKARSSPLRAIIFKSMVENPGYKSRQARFVRKYGYYSNWFNRLVFSTNRLIQGKTIPLLQLSAASLRDSISGGSVDASLRRAYYYEARYRFEKNHNAPHPEYLKKLRDRIDHSLAEADTRRAEWHLRADDPDAALFYARQALHSEPDWNYPLKVIEQAEAKLASRLRKGLASSQFIPIDSTPINTGESELMRKWLARLPISEPDKGNKSGLLEGIIKDLPGPEEGRGDMMDFWPDHLSGNENSPTSHRLWVSGMLSSQTLNTGNKLQLAVSRNKSQKIKYIFLGPERPQGHLYSTASWLSRPLNSLHNIGFLYVFEMLGRMVRISLVDAPAEEELVDIMAAWLKEENRPYDKHTRSIAVELTGYYLHLNRYQAARDMLHKHDLLTADERVNIDRKEYNWLSDRLETETDASRREPLIARLKSLDMSRYTRQQDTNIEVAENDCREWFLGWDMVMQVTRHRLPAWLPGKSEWFDEDISNGEVTMSGLKLRTLSDDETKLICEYPVLDGERTVTYSTRIPKNDLHPRLLKWMNLSDAQMRYADDAVTRSRKPRVPFELSASVGLTGMDFYPRLMPIEKFGIEDDALFTD